jgi:hypothetical protein
MFSREYLTDKAIDCFIVGPLSGCAMIGAASLLGWGSWQPYAIAALLAVAAAAIVIAVRREHRRDRHSANMDGLRALFAAQAKTLRAPSALDYKTKIMNAASVICGGLGCGAEAEFWQHVEQYPADSPAAAEAAAVFLDGRAARLFADFRQPPPRQAA